MINYKLLKFNKKLYPYADIDVYDYNLNRYRIVRTSTDELYKDVTDAVLHGNDDLKKKATEVDPTIEIYIPQEVLLTKTEDEVSKYISDHLSD